MTRALRRPRVSHTHFVVAWSTLLFAACNVGNAGRLAAWFTGRDGLDVVAFGAYLGAGLCLSIAVFTLFAHRWTTKPAAVLLTAASAAATYFIAKYDVAIDSSMLLNTLRTDAVEAGALLSHAMIPYVALLFVLPVAAILATEITFAPGIRYLAGSLRVIGVALCVALACLYANYNAILRAGNVSSKYIVYSLVPVNVLYSSLNLASKSLQATLRPAQARTPPVARVSKPEDLVVVLAIGESSRQQSFGLYGYTRRDTTPLLRAVPGLHALNGVARRASTIYALPEILEKHGFTLASVAAKAGVPTSCLVNFTMYENCAAVGETAPSDCGHAGRCYDEDVIPLLEERLRKHAPGQELFLLHFGGGSHGPVYRDRHPPEFLRFVPSCDDADVANRCTTEELYNAYDNAILYVDHVVASTIAALDRAGVPYVFLYVSDHGESLGEGGVLFHGVPPGLALPAEQARIPLLVKASVPVSIAPRAEYGQGDVYDTVLDLLSIEWPAFDRAGNFVIRR